MKKFLIINLLLVVLFNTFYSCLASENIIEKTVKYEKTCESYLKYQGNLKTVHYAYYEVDSKIYPAYCLNPEFKGVNEEMKEYSLNIDGKVTDEKIWKVIINGYPYKTLKELGVETKEEAYTATQFAIYTVLHNRNVNDYESIGTEEGNRTLKAYKKIMENALNSNEEITEKIEIISDNENWIVDSDEINILSKTYSIKSNSKIGTYKVNLKGESNDDLKVTDIKGNEKNVFSVDEKFKILVPISSLKDEQKIEIEVVSNLMSKPILYGKTMIENTQNYALVGKEYEEFAVKDENILPKNNTKLRIIKQETNSNKKLEGVKFSLLNSGNDNVYQDLITDKNGEITIESILPGIYFLQEIETKEGYQLIEEPIEINIKFDEEKEIIIENELKTVEIIEEIKEISKTEKILPVTGY